MKHFTINNNTRVTKIIFGFMVTFTFMTSIVSQVETRISLGAGVVHGTYQNQSFTSAPIVGNGYSIRLGMQREGKNLLLLQAGFSAYKGEVNSIKSTLTKVREHVVSISWLKRIPTETFRLFVGGEIVFGHVERQTKALSNNAFSYLNDKTLSFHLQLDYPFTSSDWSVGLGTSVGLFSWLESNHGFGVNISENELDRKSSLFYLGKFYPLKKFKRINTNLHISKTGDVTTWRLQYIWNLLHHKPFALNTIVHGRHRLVLSAAYKIGRKKTNNQQK